MGAIDAAFELQRATIIKSMAVKCRDRASAAAATADAEASSEASAIIAAAESKIAAFTVEAMTEAGAKLDALSERHALLSLAHSLRATGVLRGADFVAFAVGDPGAADDVIAAAKEWVCGLEQGLGCKASIINLAREWAQRASDAESEG